MYNIYYLTLFLSVGDLVFLRCEIFSDDCVFQQACEPLYTPHEFMLWHENVFISDKPIGEVNCCDVIIEFINRVAISLVALEIMTSYTFKFIHAISESNLYTAIFHVKTWKLYWHNKPIVERIGMTSWHLRPNMFDWQNIQSEIMKIMLHHV